MTNRPRLIRSIPFWLLLVGSLASFGYGGWLVLDKISTMTATLADGSATGVEVYAGQSWIVVGGAFLAAGLIGLVTVLALAVVRSFLAVPVAEAPAEESDAEESVAEESVAEDSAPHDTALGYDPGLGYVEPAELTVPAAPDTADEALTTR